MLDLQATLSPVFLGPRRDPGGPLHAAGFRRAAWTLDGPATLAVSVGGGAEAWGPGAARALAAVPGILGQEDPGADLELPVRHPGLRLCRWPFIYDLLVRRILQQRVAHEEAMRSFSMLVRKFGEPAPGPFRELRLLSPERLRRVTAGEFGWAEVDFKRARTLVEVATVWRRLEALGAADARRALSSIRGLGPWSVEWTVGLGWGDPDAVPTGDFWLPSMVSWILAGEMRAGDERMLELLEPYRGQRFRALRVMMQSGRMPPRMGPRLDPPVRVKHSWR